MSSWGLKLLLGCLLLCLADCYYCEYYTTFGNYFSYFCVWGCYEYLTTYQVTAEDCPGAQWWQIMLIVLGCICFVGGIIGWCVRRRQLMNRRKGAVVEVPLYNNPQVG